MPCPAPRRRRSCSSTTTCCPTGWPSTWLPTRTSPRWTRASGQALVGVLAVVGGLVEREAPEARDGERPRGAAPARAAPGLLVDAGQDLGQALGVGAEVAGHGHRVLVVVVLVDDRRLVGPPAVVRVVLLQGEHDAVAEHREHVPDVAAVFQRRPGPLDGVGPEQALGRRGEQVLPAPGLLADGVGEARVGDLLGIEAAERARLLLHP